MDTSSVIVAVPIPRLGSALVSALSDLLPGVTIESGTLDEGIGRIVVTTPSACSPLECRNLVNTGARVIIMSPIALASERRLYEEAGAFSYLPMAIGNTGLIANAIRLAGAYRFAEPMTSCATLSQESSPRAC